MKQQGAQDHGKEGKEQPNRLNGISVHWAMGSIPHDRVRVDNIVIESVR